VHLQNTKDLLRDLAGKSCELSAAHLDLHGWKRKAALQQLRLVSCQEDCGHQKVHIEALTAECSRRQEQCNRLHGEILAARAQTAQLETRLTDSAASSADLQVKFKHVPWMLLYVKFLTTAFSGQHLHCHFLFCLAEPAGRAAGFFARQRDLAA